MGWQKEAFEALSGANGAPKGLSSAAAEAEPNSFLRHAASLSLTKSADGLIDPKLVLSWLVATLGASSFIVGLLVPIREAGALLPQLFSAPRIHAMAQRKWAWAGAAAAQGLAVAVILIVAVMLQGAAAGWLICVALAVLAVARSVASVSYKDVLGKTVGKARRGAATGLAASTASVVVIAFALVLIWAPVPRMTLVLAALALAAAAFLGAALIFAGLHEDPTPGKADLSFQGALKQMALLRDAPMLGRFIVSRGLLTSTALAPPYLVLLGAQEGNDALTQLGALVLASAAASFLSSYVWGRLSDRSSRLVLAYAGFTGAASLALAVALGLMGLAGTAWALPVALFLLMICYHGVRQGRSTYLVDMSPEDKRTTYTAVANTAIGVALLGTGLFGAIASMAGPMVTLGIFAAMAVAGGVVALGLDHAEE